VRVGRRLELATDHAKRGDLLGRRALGGAEGAIAVDAPEQFVVIPRGVLVEANHERAAVRLDHHPALAVERDDRFAYGDPADPERSGDLVLRDALTDVQLALEDLPANVVGDLLSAGRAD
jgi:hypothetical protein